LIALVAVRALVARPVLRARDLMVAGRDPAVRRAYLSLWRAERSVPPQAPSFEAIRAARAVGVPAEALVWGETPLSLAASLLARAGVGPASTVIDLGAGRGMVLLAARLLGAQARGVELDPRRVGPAREALERAGAELAVGDALEAPLAGATHLWLSWTCMPEPTRGALVHRLRALPPGVRVVSTTWHPGPGFATLYQGTARFAWGSGDVFVVEKSAEPAPAAPTR
jgi:hypothetical protein